MRPRHSAEDMRRGIETTSAHSRALAQAGEDYPAISLSLGSRSQPIRKVLLDTGIPNGPKRRVRGDRKPVVDADPGPREVASWAGLLRAGCQCAGAWTQDAERVGTCKATAPKVWVATPEPLAWGGLPVDTAAGLEAGLIQTLRPAWSMTEAI